MPKALISGASIAGPTLAYWLARAGFAVTLVERAPAPRQGGQAIDVRGPAQTVLREMGLLGEAKALRTRLTGMSTLDINGVEIARAEDRTLTGGRFDSGDIEILRDDLSNLLLKATGSAASYIFNDSITSLHQTHSAVTAGFERAPPAAFDIVIGADGVYSNTRQLIFRNEAEALHPLGVALAIFTTPNLLDLRDWQLAFRNETSGYVIYPARGNSELRVNLGFGLGPQDNVRLPPEAQKSLVATRCAHLGGPIPRLLREMQAAPDFYFGALAQVHLPAWSAGRVALAGDAAYCPSPFTGQGTSLALIGAFVLARELARCNGDYPAAFALAETRLRPFVLKNQNLLSLDRQGHMPDALLAEAKNAIRIEDLL